MLFLLHGETFDINAFEAQRGDHDGWMAARLSLDGTRNDRDGPGPTRQRGSVIMIMSSRGSARLHAGLEPGLERFAAPPQRDQLGVDLGHSAAPGAAEGAGGVLPAGVVDFLPHHQLGHCVLGLQVAHLEAKETRV